MNARRILALARRVMRQIMRDRRTVGLLLFVPMLVLTLGAVLFRSKAAAIPLGVVNDDRGVTIPLLGTVALGQRIADELAAGDTFSLVALRREEIDRALRDVMLKGGGLAEIWPNLLILLGIALLLIGLGASTMRREVA